MENKKNKDKKEKVMLLDSFGNIIIEDALIEKSGDEIIIHCEDKYTSELLSLETVKYCENTSYAEMFEGKIIKKNNAIILKDVRNISASMRGDFKMRLNLESTLKELENPNNSCIKIILTDVSCGGIGFSSKEDLDISLEYETIITFTPEPLLLAIKILRKEKQGNEFVYGGKFNMLSDVEEIMLRKGIFLMQKKIYRKSTKVQLQDKYTLSKDTK